MDKLAKEGANLQHSPEMNLSTSENFKISEAKLNTMIQAKLYKGILATKNKTKDQRSKPNWK